MIQLKPILDWSLGGIDFRKHEGGDRRRQNSRLQYAHLITTVHQFEPMSPFWLDAILDVVGHVIDEGMQPKDISSCPLHEHIRSLLIILDEKGLTDDLTREMKIWNAHRALNNFPELGVLKMTTAMSLIMDAASLTYRSDVFSSSRHGS